MELNELKPKRIDRIIDLVHSSGIDVSAWNENPSNPKFCYNWAFEERKKVAVICVWFEEIQLDHGVPILSINLRDIARSLHDVKAFRSERRAIDTDVILQHAWNDKLPLRFVLCDGRRRALNVRHDDASSVNARELDPVPWQIKSYEWDTGKCLLIRQSVSPKDSSLGVTAEITSSAAQAYERFAQFLLNSSEDRIDFNFDEIEEIHKRPLPNVARTSSAWWANSRTADSHSWAHLWIAAGWKCHNLDLDKQTVSFSKVESHLLTQDAEVERGWSREELQASVQAYFDMFDKFRRGETISKTHYYEMLSKKLNRSGKAFEYRMQNISYILSLMGREWLPGLKPAKNVGTRIASEIEALINEFDDLRTVPIAAFEIEVDSNIKNGIVVEPTGTKNPHKSMVTVTVIERDPLVKAWVLGASNGKCDCCQNPAPFMKNNGAPYLEVHHLRRLADGGSDRPSNAVAVCPNCHKELHHGLQSKTLLTQMYSRIERLRPE